MRGLNGMPGIDGRKGERGEKGNPGNRGETGSCSPEQCLPPPNSFQMEEPVVEFDDLLLSKKQNRKNFEENPKKINYSEKDDTTNYPDFEVIDGDFVVPDVRIIEGSGQTEKIP